MGIFAIGNEELERAKKVKDGDEIVCPICQGIHKIKFTYDNGKTASLGFYECDGTPYLAAVHGKLIGEVKLARKE